MDFDFELEEKRVLKWYRTSQIKAGKISESVSIFVPILMKDQLIILRGF